MVAAESCYGDVAAQIGGAYVHVTSVVSNPTTDPHAYEVSTSVAEAIGRARVVVQNGLGYDDFMSRIESASPSRSRHVIVVQKLLGLPRDTRNPHLWYDPGTMPAVARALAAAFSSMQPGHAGYFEAAESRFDASLRSWIQDVAAFRSAHRGVAVAAVEPVAGYLLEAVGADDKSPYSFQAAVMNGVDPAPQDLATESSLVSGRRISALIYNEQVIDPLTQGLLTSAHLHHVPVVAVYETMPGGYDYQTWMAAELSALDRAVTTGSSTEHL